MENQFIDIQLFRTSNFAGSYPREYFCVEDRGISFFLFRENKLAAEWGPEPAWRAARPAFTHSPITPWAAHNRSLKDTDYLLPPGPRISRYNLKESGVNGWTPPPTHLTPSPTIHAHTPSPPPPLTHTHSQPTPTTHTHTLPAHYTTHTNTLINTPCWGKLQRGLILIGSNIGIVLNRATAEYISGVC